MTDQDQEPIEITLFLDVLRNAVKLILGIAIGAITAVLAIGAGKF